MMIISRRIVVLLIMSVGGWGDDDEVGDVAVDDDIYKLLMALNKS